MTPIRIVLIALLITALAAGAGMYYLQAYAFYQELSAEEAEPMTLVTRGAAQAAPIVVSDLRAIDSASSPIRYRACFLAAESPRSLAAQFQPYMDPRPPVAPGWFDCFDAQEVGEALESGAAQAYLSLKDVRYGIDRVVAILADGRGVAWHQINACGAVVFDGKPPPLGCPPLPESE